MNRPEWQPTELAVPAENPLPWLSEMWGPEADVPLPPSRNTQDVLDAALAAVQKALNTFVIGLADDDTSYRVVLGKSSTAPAMTSYEEHIVYLGTKPWTHYLEGKLTFGQLVAVFTGLAYHEVGHVRFDRADYVVMQAWMNGKYTNDTVKGVAGAVNNVARDLRLEAYMQQTWPGFAEALRVAMWWVSTSFGEPVTSIDTSSVIGRMQAFTAGSRYPWEPDWTGHESLRDEWLDWAARCETAVSLSDFQSLTVEGTDRIIGEADEDGPEPDEPGTEPGEDKGDDKGTDGPSGSEPTETDPDEDTEGDDKGDTEGDDKGDTEGEGEDESDTKGEPEEPDDFGTPPVTTEGEDKPDKSEPDDDAEGDDESDEKGTPSKDGDPTDGDSDDSEKPEDTEGEDEATFDHDSETNVDRTEADDSAHGGWGKDDAEGIEDIQKTRLGCASKMSEDIDDVKRQDTISGHAAKQRTNKTMTFEYNAGSKGLRSRTIVSMRLNKHADEVYPAKPGDKFEVEASANLSYTTRGEMGYRRTKDDTSASQQLAAVMASSRRGPGSPEYSQRSGRIDRRRVGRLAFGEGRIFQKPDAAAPQKVNVGILIDASGSMSYGDGDGYGGRHEVPNIEKAAQVGRNLASAVERLPWARGFVAAHTTGYGVEASGPIYIPIWESGEPTLYLDDVLTISLSGNEDGFAVAMAAENVLSDLKRNEKGLLIVISDGAPAYSNGETHTREVVDTYRKRGLRIVSVSISASLRMETQELMYGADEVIAYTKNASAFAQSMARVIGSSI